MEAFLGFIKENLHVDVSKDQLKNKIKRLKQKYQSIAEKGKSGEAPVLGKAHDYRIFDLSKKIWEASLTNGVEGSAKKKRKPKATQSEPKNSASALPKPTQSESKTFVSALPNGETNAEPARPHSSFYDALLAQGKLLSIPEGVANFMKEALPLMGSVKTRELESEEREKLKKERDHFGEQLHERNEKELALREMVQKLETKAGKEEVENKNLTIRVVQLEKSVTGLEQMVRDKDEGILGLAEEKREAIRQLCLWIDYHRSRYDYLKVIISKTPRTRRAT